MRHPSPRPPVAQATRRLSLLLVVAVAMSVVGVWGAPDAGATSYRFWSYWTGGTDWTFSSQGAARRPADGSVDGWRFAISPASTSSIPPRHAPSFASLCGKTPAQDGKKRVGLVVDSGVSGDAPSGESPPAMIATCAVVPEDANGYDVLMTVASMRTDRGLICGINGYPASECGKAVVDPGPSPSDDPPHDPNDPSGPGDSSDQGGGDQGGGRPGGRDADDSGRDGAQKGSKDDKGKKKNDERDRDGESSADPSPSEVAALAATSTPAAPSSGSPVGLLIGLAVVIVIGAAALLVRRRRT